VHKERPFFNDLVNYIVKNYDSNSTFVNLEINSIETILPVKTALSCGLIINELVSNSLKHAFKDRKIGTIKINLEHVTGEFILSVEDDGSGLPEDFDIDNSDSLGLTLVKSLSDQVNGSLTIIGINGAGFVLKFPNNDKSK